MNLDIRNILHQSVSILMLGVFIYNHLIFMTIQEAKLFVARFVSGGYSPEEYAAFEQWLEKASLQDYGTISDEYEALQDKWPQVAAPSSRWTEQLEQKLDRIDQQSGQETLRRIRPGKQIRRISWIAAASVFLLLSVSVYWWYHSSGGMAPGSTPRETILKTPRGQQWQLVLADGTRVWLNAASTLRYPASFTGRERNVELSGEAYFEVAKNTARPFRVQSGDLQVEAVGTHFDMLAYEDDSVSKTSLLEGSVRVRKGAATAVLTPGEAAIAYTSSGMNSSIRIIQGIKPEIVLAWKNGYLQFDNDNLQTVMRAISRCYDVDIQYKGAVPARQFSGKFPSNDIRQVLKVLELQQVHFKFDGKIITVMP